MADKTYRRDRYGRDQYDRDRSSSRQAEQFDNTDYTWRDDERSYGQMEAWRDEDYDQFDTAGQSYSRDFNREPGYRRQGTSRTGRPDYARYMPERDRGFSSFTGSDQGGRDFNAPRYTASRAYRPYSYGAGSQLAANHGEWRDNWGEYGAGYSGSYDRARNDRGWFERAGDEISSWFGDDDAQKRRRADYRGHGPANYTRSDERIREDANDALTDDYRVDARKVTVTVDNGDVTLDGTVPSRDQKRRAEDCVDNLSGVKNVQNNLRVEQASTWDTSETANVR